MGAETIVSCGGCGQPFAVPAAVFDALPPGQLQVPDHLGLNPDGRPSNVRCHGSGLPAMARADAAEWEEDWRRFHDGGVLPEVLDGREVRTSIWPAG